MAPDLLSLRLLFLFLFDLPFRPSLRFLSQRSGYHCVVWSLNRLGLFERCRFETDFARLLGLWEWGYVFGELGLNGWGCLVLVRGVQ